MSYGVTADEAARFGLPCGGRVTLVLEPLASDALASVVDAIRARRLVVRHLDVSAGKARVEPARAATEAFSFDGGYMSRVFGPRWRLLMVGAGQIAGYLAEIARSLDYEVQLCDPRSEQLQGWEARHERIDLSMPDDCLRRMQPDERTAVVTLSHDPKLDDLALLEALDSPAFYVGALGSTRSHDRRRQRLASLGVSPDGLERLRGPVGLPIGSRTPPEIAVSIVAELTAARRGAKAADQRLRQPTSRHSEP